MKKQWILYMLLLGFLSLNAQAQRSDAIFLSTEGVLGNYTGLNLDLNYQFRQSISISIGLNYFSKTTKDAPVYIPARHEISDYHLMVGKVFPSRKGKIRWNLSAGIAQVNTSHPDGYSTHNSNWWDVFVGNSDWINQPVTQIEYAESKGIKLIINPKIEMLISNFFGFSISAIYLPDPVRPAFGIGCGMIIGKLR